MDKFYFFQATLMEDRVMPMPMPMNTMKDPLDLDEKVLLKEMRYWDSSPWSSDDEPPRP